MVLFVLICSSFALLRDSNLMAPGDDNIIRPIDQMPPPCNEDKWLQTGATSNTTLSQQHII